MPHSWARIMPMSKIGSVCGMGPMGTMKTMEVSKFPGRETLIDEGTNGKLTEPKLSTVEGLKMTQTIKMEWAKKHGGTRNWDVFELEVANQDNMNRDGPADNIDTYVMCVLNAPKDMKAVMSPAHDDWAQIWINGDKWYNDRTLDRGRADRALQHRSPVDERRECCALPVWVSPAVPHTSICTLTKKRTGSARSTQTSRKIRKDFFSEVQGVSTSRSYRKGNIHLGSY